jgi:hypothetical protein
MSGGGGSSLGTSQIRVSVTNLAPCSSKPEVPKNGGDCIESGDPSLSDCRDEPLQRALATVETAAAAEGADLVLLPETFACGGMDMHEMKGYADKQVASSQQHRLYHTIFSRIIPSRHLHALSRPFAVDYCTGLPLIFEVKSDQ